MVDILERLQSPQTSLGTLWPEPNLHEEAAEKIIQMREELAAVTERMSKLDFERTAAELERDALREENERLREALKPFADLFLYPDDLGFEHSEDIRSDPDWDDDANDMQSEETFVLRRDIRRARFAIQKEHNDD